MLLPSNLLNSVFILFGVLFWFCLFVVLVLLNILQFSTLIDKYNVFRELLKKKPTLLLCVECSLLEFYLVGVYFSKCKPGYYKVFCSKTRLKGVLVPDKKFRTDK